MNVEPGDSSNPKGTELKRVCVQDGLWAARRIEALEAEIARLKKELTDTRLTYYEVVEQRNKFHSEVAKLNGELKDADAGYDSLETETIALRAQLDTANERIRKLEAKQ